jgi:hypothetical protein
VNWTLQNHKDRKTSSKYCTAVQNYEPLGLALRALAEKSGRKKKEKKRQIGFNHNQEGIGHSRQPEGQVDSG